MKNLIILFVLSIFGYTSVNAQTASTNYKAIDQSTETKVNSSDNDDDVVLLNSFKPDRTQKKVISKVRSYVTPKVFTQKVNTAAFADKAVKLQMGLDQAGGIKYIVVVEGIEKSIDARVIELVKAYNAEKPFASSKLEKGAVVQMDIPVVTKKYYGTF